MPYVGHKASYSTLGRAVVELKRDTRGIPNQILGQRAILLILTPLLRAKALGTGSHSYYYPKY